MGSVGCQQTDQHGAVGELLKLLLCGGMHAEHHIRLGPGAVICRQQFGARFGVGLIGEARSGPGGGLHADPQTAGTEALHRFGTGSHTGFTRTTLPGNEQLGQRRHSRTHTIWGPTRPWRQPFRFICGDGPTNGQPGAPAPRPAAGGAVPVRTAAATPAPDIWPASWPHAGAAGGPSGSADRCHSHAASSD